MRSSVNFGNAIQKVLVANAALITLTSHGTADITRGETIYSIGEHDPNAVGQVPYVGWNIVETVPLLSGEGINHWFTSIVWIHATAYSSLDTARLADAIEAVFTEPSEGEECRGWFRDISDTCIFNRFTTFLKRKKFGRAGTNVFEEESDTYDEAVAIKFIWRDYPCTGLYCADITEDDCPPEDSTYDDDCIDC